jgi:hypothetical protein
MKIKEASDKKGDQRKDYEKENIFLFSFLFSLLSSPFFMRGMRWRPRRGGSVDPLSASSPSHQESSSALWAGINKSSLTPPLQ